MNQKDTNLLDSFNSDELDYKKSKLDIELINKKFFCFFVKRIIDVVGSLLGLIILSPLFLMISIAMKLEEPNAPIFFSQIRIGRNETSFKMYKIRSMCVDAEDRLAELLKHNEIEGAMFKMKDDPRITRVGKLIRKTSIDELPQLWNVLKGDMSLVGPRPPLEREVMDYTEYDKQRLLIRPGCTGLWQISGRNAVSFNDMVKLDITYIKNISFGNDIKIIFKTLSVMLFPNDAY